MTEPPDTLEFEVTLADLRQATATQPPGCAATIAVTAAYPGLRLEVGRQYAFLLDESGQPWAALATYSVPPDATAWIDEQRADEAVGPRAFRFERRAP